jgi:hypothetical protein
MAAPFARAIQIAANAPAALPALRSGQANFATAPQLMTVATRD